MTEHHDETFNLDLSRRELLVAAGLAGAALATTSLAQAADGQAVSLETRPSDPVTTPPIAGLHLQFGADASSEMVVSWHTLQPVQNPKVVLGHLDGRFEQTVDATPTSYTDAKSNKPVYAYHAK